jgi:hypothetical protein
LVELDLMGLIEVASDIIYGLYEEKPREVVVTAACAKTRQGVREPEIGCGHCHEVLDGEIVEP